MMHPLRRFEQSRVRNEMNKPKPQERARQPARPFLLDRR